MPVETQGVFIRTAIYARVSTSDQSPEMQINLLREYASSRGFTICDEYIDHGFSGKDCDRPALKKLIDDARKKKFDAVLVYRFDRFARSTKHLVSALEEFKNLGIDFISYSENVDTSSAIGTAVFAIIGAIAELERNLIVERVKAGLENAKMKGKTLGRPKANFSLSRAHYLRNKGYSVRAIAKELEVSKTSVAKYLSVKPNLKTGQEFKEFQTTL